MKAQLIIRQKSHDYFTAWLNWEDGDISACQADSLSEVYQWVAECKAEVR